MQSLSDYEYVLPFLWLITRSVQIANPEKYPIPEKELSGDFKDEQWVDYLSFVNDVSKDKEAIHSLIDRGLLWNKSNPLVKEWSTAFYLKPENINDFLTELDECICIVHLYYASIRASIWSATYKSRNPRHGFVYLIQSPTGYYKIGKTVNPNNRMKTFSVKLPFEVEYVCLFEVEDMSAMERFFHDMFSSRHVNGEWYALSTDDVEQMKTWSQQLKGLNNER